MLTSVGAESATGVDHVAPKKRATRTERVITRKKFVPTWTELADAPPVLTVDEVAYVMRVCPRTVRSEIASGRLQALRLGRAIRIMKIEVMRYVEGR